MDGFAAAARVHGAGPWRAFFIITLPLSIPAIAASLLIVFAMSIEEFGTPAALAARTGFEVLVTGIYTRLSDWPIDLSGAAPRLGDADGAGARGLHPAELDRHAPLL